MHYLYYNIPPLCGEDAVRPAGMKNMSKDVKMDKTSAQRIQSNADITNINQGFKERAMRAAEKNDQRK